MRIASLLLLSVALAQMPDLTRPLDYLAHRASSNNADADSNDDSKRPIPGETTVLANLTGPGVVNHIWLTVAASEYGWPRLLRFRVYYDGSATPSVDAPLGDFFGVGHGLEREINSLAVRNSSSGRSRNCYWQMPFRRSIRITVTNEGRRRVHNLYYHVDWKKLPALAADTLYFHARYRQALPAAAGKPYEILSTRGRGHYVGTVLNVVQNEPGWFGEGDEHVYVDGGKKAVMEGTGTEDYFNDAWSFRISDGPYAGVPVADGTGLGARLGAYRWHLNDPIPFRLNFRFDIEHAGWTYTPEGRVRSAFEERADLFSSVAYWYQEGIARDQPEPPFGRARLPHGNARQIEAEQFLREVKTERGKAEVQKEVFWSRDLLYFRAEGPGAKIEVPFNIEREAVYELAAQIAHAPDYGDYNVLLDGKALSGADLENEPGANMGGDAAIRPWHHEVYVAEEHVLGWRKLAAGRHTLAFVCVGKDARSRGHHLGIDTLIVAEAGRPAVTGGERAVQARRWGQLGAGAYAHLAALVDILKDGDAWTREAAAWAFTQMGAAATPADQDLQRALFDGSPVVRGLAALALRNLGPAGRSTQDALISRLKDDDENVRLMAAEALGAQKAVAALKPLMAAAQRPNEHVHVLRSVATALGNVGTEAREAAPVLEKLRELPRVRWAAEAALKKIGK